jgi:hypothetical protein
MERGFYRGAPTSVAALPRRPKRLARAEQVSGGQTGITTIVDLTGLSIGFTVTDFPVRVRLVYPFVYNSLAAAVAQMNITDAANTVTQYAVYTAPAANTGGRMIAEEVITVRGTYTRKGRMLLNSGGGTVNTFADAASIAFIEAVEFEV